MIEFLDFYVAQKVPTIPPTVRLLAPAIWAVDHRRLRPDDPARPLRPDDGLRRPRWRSSSPTRRCASTGRSGTRRARSPARRSRRAQTRYAAWPIPDVEADGVVLPARRRARRRRRRRAAARADPTATMSDPDARPRTSYTGSGGGIWHANPTYDWKPVVDGKSLVVHHRARCRRPSRWPGTGSVDLWVASSRPRRGPAGDAERGAAGRHRALRAERLAAPEPPQARPRALDRRSRRSTPTLEEDARPVPRGRFVQARVQIFPFAYSFRAGSRIRLTVQAPGRRPPAVDVRHADRGPRPAIVRIAHDRDHPSRVVLPVLHDEPGRCRPTPAPCPSLRAEPCRTYVAPGRACRRAVDRAPRLRPRVQGRQARTSASEPGAREGRARAADQARPADAHAARPALRARPGRRSSSSSSPC